MKNLTGLIDSLLERLGGVLTVGLFERIEARAVDAADVSTLVSAMVGLAMGVVLSIKTDSFLFFVAGVAWPVLLLVCYYVGSKLQIACARALVNNPSEIGNQEYLSVVTLLNILGAIVSFLVGAYLSIKLSTVYPLLVGFGIGVFCVYVAWQTLQPALVTTFVQDTASAGLEAIALLVLNSKILLRSNKIIFGVSTSIGAGLMVRSLFSLFGEEYYDLMMGGMQGLGGFVLVLSGLLSPFVLYVTFIVGYMFLDVVRSLLGLSRPATPIERPPVQSSALAENNSSLPPGVASKIGLGLLIAFIGVGGIIKGKEFYHDYQARAEQKRVEEEARKAEEARLKAEEDARIAAENAKKLEVAALAEAAKKYVGKPSIDLVLDQKINEKFKEIFRNQMPEFEKFFIEAANVVEADGLVFGLGCRANECGQNEALAVVDPANVQVFAILFANGQTKYFGISGSDVPPVIKKLVLEKQNP